MAQFERVIPFLVYEDIPAAHTFLVDVFGFTAGGVYRDAEGRPVHGEVSIGQTTVWLHAVAPEHGAISARGQEAVSGGFVVFIEDVDTHCALVRAAGGEIVTEPADQPYGQREYMARDPEGRRWWFASAIDRSLE
jgi:MerR family transcriptional regulator, thiopeptide resistance regulator